MYEKCIDFFTNQVVLILSSLPSKGRSGLNKSEIALGKAVKLLLISVINLAKLYQLEKEIDLIIEILQFGFWMVNSTLLIIRIAQPI